MDFSKGQQLPASGSSRVYYRLPSGVIGCHGTSRQENHAFITLSRQFFKAGLPVPEILEVSDNEMDYTQTDAGKKSLFDLLNTSQAPQLLEDAMKLLARVHQTGHRVADYSVCFPVSEMDRSSVFWDLNYFKYCFLKNAKPDDIDEPGLERDFETLSAILLSAPRDVFMVRDFQSRNLIVNDAGHLTLIDFQGGRRGPREYDLASFLWQARAGFTPRKREELLNVYIDQSVRLGFEDAEGLRRRLPYFVLFRILQTLGAYGFRGTVQHRELFTTSAHAALRNLKELVKVHKFEELPYLSHIFSPKLLTVNVNSFAYPKGYPDDDSGNGGGFVFDCRACHNPGRYDQFKHLTGMDREVEEFIEQIGDTTCLVKQAVEMVTPSVQTYLKRGFESLQVSFGCTGGRHRSVYAAEHFARAIKKAFPQIIVTVTHHEQKVSRIL